MPTAECPVCFEDYTFPEHGLFFHTCGHGICAPCSRRQAWLNCPSCRTKTPHPPRRIYVRLEDDVAPDIEGLISSLLSAITDAQEPGQLASVEQAIADDDEMRADAEAEEACDALKTLLEWPSFEHDHRAKLVVRDAYVAVLHFRAAHMKVQNHRRQLLADLDIHDVRVAALEDVNKRLLEIRELTKKQLQASEQARKDKEKALAEYKRAKEQEFAEYKRTKERELAERRNTQRVLEEHSLSQSIRSKRLDELYTEQQQAVAKLEEEVQTLRKDNAALRKEVDDGPKTVLAGLGALTVLYYLYRLLVAISSSNSHNAEP